MVPIGVEIVRRLERHYVRKPPKGIRWWCTRFAREYGAESVLEALDWMLEMDGGPDPVRRPKAWLRAVLESRRTYEARVRSFSDLQQEASARQRRAIGL